MTISKWEAAALALSGLFLAFTAGWFLRGTVPAQPIRVETQRVLEATVTALPAPTQDTERRRVNINTASAQELMALPGIGEKRAANIIADREENGPFRFPEDITRVKGIGEETLAELLNDITVEDEP